MPPDQQPIVDLGASFVCGTSTEPPLNPMFQYATATLGLTLKPKVGAVYKSKSADP